MLHEQNIHPVDLHEAMLQAEQSGIRWAADVANRWVGSEYYARIAGSTLKMFLAAESARRVMFPFIPAWGIGDQMRLFEHVEQQVVGSWGLALHLISSGRGVPANLRERVERWQHVTSTRYPIAPSPKELVYQDGIVKLYRYTVPDGSPARRRVPLLLVFAIMNTPWVLDLYRGNSFVSHMVEQGYDVYLVDWGSPGHAERHWTFETYALQHLPRIAEVVKQQSGCDEFSILSWCLGAVISTIYASMRPEDGLKNLILLTPPLDFSSDDIEFRTWLRHIDVDQLLRAHDGLMPAELIELGAQTLKPVDNTFGNLLALWHRIGDARFTEGWHAMHTWLGMNVSMPGGVYAELVKKLYLGNALTEGRFAMNGSPVDLSRMRANTLALVALSDHITPPEQMRRAFPLIGSGDKTLEELRGGHIGAMVGGSAQKDAWPRINAWLDPRSQ